METSLNMKRSRFISNTFTPRKKQIEALQEKWQRISRELEAHVPTTA
jgi:hypothetical protein